MPVDGGTTREVEEQAPPELPKLNGVELRSLREDFGWSRKQLSDATTLTISAIATVELGKRPPTDRETRLITDILLNFLEEELDAPGPVNIRKDYEREGVIRIGEWNGLRRGDPCKVRGESGTFRFLFYHQDDEQAYIEVFGPTFTRRKNPKAPARRSFTLDRVTKVK